MFSFRNVRLLIGAFAVVAVSALAAAAAPTEPKPVAAASTQAAQTPETPGDSDAGPLLRVRTTTEVNLSSAQERAYRIVVSAPQGEPPRAGFPVFYVLDGDAWFGTAVEVAKMREYEKLDPALVVGIASPQHVFFAGSRSYDFTPPGAVDADFEGIRLGGADEFRAFIEDKVKPWLRMHYKIDAQRQTLFGHSLGGTFALYVLFNAPESFNTYIIASPHMRFANGIVLKGEAAFEASPARLATRVLVTDGGLESHRSADLVEDYRRYYTAHAEAHPGQSVDEAIADLFPDNHGYDKIAQTRKLVARLAKHGVKATYVEFPGEEHMSAAISALNRGIPFALRPAH